MMSTNYYYCVSNQIANSFIIYHIFRLLFRSIEILWNLIENGDKKQVAEQLNTMVAISELRESFLQQLLQGYSNYDRQLRLLFD